MADWQEKLRVLEGINTELSACAGFRGLFEVENEESAFAEYLKKERISETMEHATHIVWATGGGLMPDA
jgi:D-serine dehydratase